MLISSPGNPTQNSPQGRRTRGTRGRYANRYRTHSRYVMQAGTPVWWLDAMDVPATSGLVDIATWPAKVGVSPAQTNAAKKPEFQPNGWFDGGPVVSFDNVNECMTTATSVFAGLSQFSISATYGHRGTAGSKVLLECGTAYSNGGVIWGGSNLGAALFAPMAGHSVGGGPYAILVGGISNPTPVVQTSKHDLALGGSEVEVWANGISRLLAWGNTANITPPIPATTMNLGSRNDGASLPFDGDLRELYITSGIWSANQRLLVERLLSYRARLL
jgi:hypothetical protein